MYNMDNYGRQIPDKEVVLRLIDGPITGNYISQVVRFLYKLECQSSTSPFQSRAFPHTPR